MGLDSTRDAHPFFLSGLNLLFGDQQLFIMIDLVNFAIGSLLLGIILMLVNRSIKCKKGKGGNATSNESWTYSRAGGGIATLESFQKLRNILMP